MKVFKIIFFLVVQCLFVSTASADDCADCQDSCDAKLKTRLQTCDADYSGSGLDRCKRAAVYQWNICWKQCDFRCDDNNGGSGSSGGYVTEATPCPAGMKRNPLGICVAYFKQVTQVPGKDGCPPGEERGADDRCVPILKIKAIAFADGYLVSCPDGMVPSPIDGGCVLSTVGETENPDALCPKGTEPGPDDRCVPVIKELGKNAMLDNTIITLSKRDAVERAGVPDLPVEDVQDLDPVMLKTYDVESVIFTASEQLEAEQVTPQ